MEKGRKNRKPMRVNGWSKVWLKEIVVQKLCFTLCKGNSPGREKCVRKPWLGSVMMNSGSIFFRVQISGVWCEC